MCFRCFRALLALIVFGLNCQADDWPRYRGADGNGISSDSGIPTNWTEKDFAWKIELPGTGHGTPVIWGRHLFVNSSKDGVSRTLHCRDALTGEAKWERSLELTANKKHKKNSYASSSPATDGERVYVTFADDQAYLLAAFTMEGEAAWSKKLPGFQAEHGHGSSPIVFEDLVIIANEQNGPSSLIAFDRRDGKQVWETKRTPREAAYCTPLIIEPPGLKPQLISVSGSHGITAYDPWTGAEIWTTGSFPKRVVASPTFVNGMVYGQCGQGGKGELLFGVSPTGKGNVRETHVKLDRTRDLPYVPSVVAYGDELYLWGDGGVVTCLDPKKNEPIWQQRVGGSYSSSPVVINGRMYSIDEAGEVHVIDAKPKFYSYGTSPAGGPSYSSPVVANGRLYLRSFKHLVCVPGQGVK